jgi:hypothetical protein
MAQPNSLARPLPQAARQLPGSSPAVDPGEVMPAAAEAPRGDKFTCSRPPSLPLLRALPLLYFSPRARPTWPPWPSPDAAVPRIREQGRRVQELRWFSLLLPSKGIEEGRHGSPPSHRFCRQTPRSLSPIRRRRRSCGRFDFPGGLRVSPRSGWPFPRPPSCLAVAAGEPAGAPPAVTVVG